MSRSLVSVTLIAGAIIGLSGELALGQIRSFWHGQGGTSAPDATEIKIIDEVPENGYILTDIVITVAGNIQMHHLVRVSQRDDDTAPLIDRFAGRFIDSGIENPDRKLDYHFSSGIVFSPGKQVWLWNVPVLADVTISGYVPQANRKHASASDISGGSLAMVALAIGGVITGLSWRRQRA